MYKIDCSWLAQHCKHDVEHVRTCIAVKFNNKTWIPNIYWHQPQNTMSWLNWTTFCNGTKILDCMTNESLE